MEQEGVEHYFFSMPDSIAWLLNIRGGDVTHTPVPLSYGILHSGGQFEWFIGEYKVSQEIRLRYPFVNVNPLGALREKLESLNTAIGIDEKNTPEVFFHYIKNAKEMSDPCILLKACKNEKEQECIRKAHIADARALIDFHKWLKDPKTKKGDELSVEKQLEDFRRVNPAYKESSFNTITGYQANGAIIHYRATKNTNQKIMGKGLLLVDSGGQYLGDDYAGTTDVTRTFSMGEPTYEQKFNYTLVLKAHIAIARAKFPYGATGVQVDTLARAVLWEEGLDFAHGLGHGVGCFLNVHEEAASLSPRGTLKIEPGMLLSNEPGIYLEGQYGIRIENLMLVQKTGDKDILGRDMLCFETVTLAPYDNDLIDFTLLNSREMSWLQGYYQKIEDTMG
jgi:Xaa-Pro aminopeptidase